MDMPAAVPCDAAAHSDSDGSHCDAEASACPSNTNRRGQKGGIVKRKGAKRAGTAAKGRGAAAAAAKKPKAETCLLGVLQPFTIVKVSRPNCTAYPLYVVLCVLITKLVI